MGGGGFLFFLTSTFKLLLVLRVKEPIGSTVNFVWLVWVFLNKLLYCDGSPLLGLGGLLIIIDLYNIIVWTINY